MTNQEILTKAIAIVESRGLSHDYIVARLAMGNRELIFDHDFAKALWGEDKTTVDPITHYKIAEWKYQLMQMVIADNPIKYLGENI